MHTLAGTVSDTVLENQTGRVRALLVAVQPDQSATGKLAALSFTIIVQAAAAKMISCMMLQLMVSITTGRPDGPSLL